MTHLVFGEALELAVAILPTQLKITKLVRQLPDDERHLFQETLNQHPLMLQDFVDNGLVPEVNPELAEILDKAQGANPQLEQDDVIKALADLDKEQIPGLSQKSSEGILEEMKGYDLTQFETPKDFIKVLGNKFITELLSDNGLERLFDDTMKQSPVMQKAYKEMENSLEDLKELKRESKQNNVKVSDSCTSEPEENK